MKNSSLEKWRNGESSIGAWISLTDLHTAETLAHMDFDWVCFDLQHGLLSYSHLLTLIPAITGTDTTPLVRVSKNDAGEIGRALDAGAHGVIVPMVNSVEEAEMAVAACRYPPVGGRSCGPMRGILLSGVEYLATANDQVACIVMIETHEGLKNVEAIARAPGVDALFIGPIDLCYGLGITPGDFSNPRFVLAVETIKEACKAAGCAAGFFGYSAELARSALDQGFTFVSAGTDINFFREGAKSALGISSAVSTLEMSKPSVGY
ncbi:MAG: hypothetical protein JKY45_11810 [Emcibacter sp.]|nr:hypothetical protein [Emcibacter sp.]